METTVDLATWPRAEQFRFFRTFERPHYAVTSRVDVTPLMRRKDDGLSVYRASLFAIGAGVHAVPELCMRFRQGQVVRHDVITLSMTVPTLQGAFGYAYVPFDPDFETFDHQANALITDAASGAYSPNTKERDDLAYLSCLPWLDYTSINNAMPDKDDCIPRISWGKIVPTATGWDMSMTLEVHHALVDGEQVGAYFSAVAAAVSSFQT